MTRQIFNRDLVAIRLLGLSKPERPAQGPRLVMVQIDGLSLTQFIRAVKKGRLPFLSHLLSRENYVLHTLYSGLPSNTPAVQGELFFGIKGCIPSFSFVDRKTAQQIKMFDASYVEHFQAGLDPKKRSLLEGGSAYSNIFTGGAQDAHFCFAHLGWEGVLRAVNPLVLPFLIILYFDIFVRTFALLVVEFFIALFECVRGTLKGRLFFEELHFVWIRVLVCVFLRELVITGAGIDIIRGLPVIHLNLLGYDEQSHCRGPSSKYAHWSLRGIDHAIRRLDRLARRYSYHSCDLWVYSDHGQEKTTPYLIRYGRTLESAVEELFQSPPPEGRRLSDNKMSWAGLLKKDPKGSKKLPFDFQGREVIVTAMGPLGQIYIKKNLDIEQLEFYARGLVSEVKIPLVLMREGTQTVKAFTAKGVFTLPEEMDQVFGKDHPFLEDMKEDIVRICFHPNAGEFTIAGWAEGSEAISFPLEYGAHAGMGVEETRAFALLPAGAPVAHNKTHLRPDDLGQAAQNYLNKRREAHHLREQSMGVSVPRTDLTQGASDHLPLLVDLKLK